MPGIVVVAAMACVVAAMVVVAVIRDRIACQTCCGRSKHRDAGLNHRARTAVGIIRRGAAHGH